VGTQFGPPAAGGRRDSGTNQAIDRISYTAKRSNVKPIRQVLVTGGAGYVGAVLVPKLLGRGYRVKVLDLYIYGEHVLDAVKDNPGLEQIKGDIRHRALLERVMPGCDAVIHLACISNDPSFELDPGLGRSINYEFNNGRKMVL